MGPPATEIAFLDTLPTMPWFGSSWPVRCPDSLLKTILMLSLMRVMLVLLYCKGLQAQFAARQRPFAARAPRR